MTQQLFERELHYQAMMSVCRSMQKKGIMSDKDIAEAERLLNEKYKPIRIGENDSIYCCGRVIGIVEE